MYNFDKQIKNIIGKPKIFGGKKDWDGDGVPNKRDCQPRNTMRQDVTYKNRHFMIYIGSPGGNDVVSHYLVTGKMLEKGKSTAEGEVPKKAYNLSKNLMIGNKRRFRTKGTDKPVVIERVN